MTVDRESITKVVATRVEKEPPSRQGPSGPSTEPVRSMLAGELPWTLKPSTLKKKSSSSPKSPVTDSHRTISSTQCSPEPSNQSLPSMEAAELSLGTGPSLPLHENSPPEPELHDNNPPKSELHHNSPPNSQFCDSSPPDSERASTPSTITPLTPRMAINTESDGDDEKSPTFTRALQIPRKSVGSGSSRKVSKKDTSQTPDSAASGGDGALRGLFRKKEGKARESTSDSVKGKAVEQDEADEDFVALKVSQPQFIIRFPSNVM